MDFKTDYLSKLNPMQQKAVTHKDGPLLILAGAGSGKTSTMTHRIAYLIQEEGVSPYQILAVTFTNKAAREMRERVEDLIGACENIWILTFHSACLRILRMYADRIGYDKNFVIYDPTDQKTLINSCMKELNINSKEYQPSYVLSIISDCKEKDISPEEFEAESSNNFKYKVIAQLYKSYEKKLRANNAMDFDDLILKTVHLFEKDKEVLQHFQNRFRYIMVDEYQDTNHMQYRFIKMLAQAHNNICVVGDDDQCIYEWRGADITNILNFEKDFRNSKVVKLEQNYRSHANILAAAHSVIKNNKGRKPKKLWTDKEEGDKIQYFRADDDKEEARFIAVEIERLKAKGRKYSDFAILYRTNVQSRPFEEAFTRRGIPYRVLAGFRYYDRKEVKDLLAYMRLVQNPSDNLSLERIINEPKRGIGPKTIEKIRALASLKNSSLFEVLADRDVIMGLPKNAAEKVWDMVELITQLSSEKDNLRVSDIYDSLLVRTGYLKALEEQKTIEAEGRIENLLEFKSIIYDYEKEKQDNNEMGSLEEFMESIALMAEVDNHDESEDAVVLMTLHSAKGLEFPVVFIPGMEEGLFPSWRAKQKPDGIEEERRLCYVGMTRAMERLYLTSAVYRTMYGRTDYTLESTFLHELDKSLVEGDPIYSTEKFDRYSLFDDVDYDSSIFRPFDTMREVKKKSSPQSINVEAGDMVYHKKFGQGKVLEVDGNTARIDFDSVGTKKLALDIAPLEKI
ncbi:MAG: DNA helicase PcrA [Clostridiales bacterium]|nr:DNA helicase PcrA [Clostridiales bacterium]